MLKIEGELWATQAAVRALIKLHPDMNAAALAVQREIETLIAHALPSEMPEDFLDGVREGKSKVLPSAKDVAEWRARR